jgi:hypothetical protein
VALVFNQRHLLAVLECPDGKGGLVLWLQEQEPCVAAHAELPVNGCSDAVLSPDRSRLLVLDNAGRAVTITTAIGEPASLQIATQAPRGRIVSAGLVNGARPALGLLYTTLEQRGVVRLWGIQRACPERDVAKVTFLTALCLGQPGAAMDQHPRLPLAAVATVAGVVQLLDIETACLTSDAASQTGCVLFSAVALPAGKHQHMQWSPDGKLLAVLNRSHNRITWLELSPSSLHAQYRSLRIVGKTDIKKARMQTWLTICKQHFLAVSCEHGEITILQLHKSSNSHGASDICTTASSVLLPASANAVCPVPALHTDTEASLLLAGQDGSLCIVKVPCDNTGDLKKCASKDIKHRAIVVATAAQVCQ